MALPALNPTASQFLFAAQTVVSQGAKINPHVPALWQPQ